MPGHPHREDQRHEREKDDTHHPEPVDIGQQARLLLHHGVKQRLRLVQSVGGTRMVGKNALLKGVYEIVGLRPVRRHMINQNALVILLPTGDERRHDSNADAAAEVAHHVDDGRGVVVLVRRHPVIGRGVDRDEEQRQSQRLIDPGPGDGPIVDLGIEIRHVEEGH